MPSYPLRALVLRKTKLGETDVIVTLASDQGRQVRAVAKGLRKPGSRFGGRLEPFSIVDLLLHTGRTLEVVSEVRTVDTHAGVREDLDRSTAGAVVVDLLDKVLVEGQEEPKLYALADVTLATLESAPVERLPQVVIAFLIKALAIHGYRPQLDACVSCACEIDGGAGLSPAHGGVLCPACGELDPSALRFPEAARRWLETLLGSTMAQVTKLDMPPAAVSDCFTLVRSFVTYHVPARLKALDYFAGGLV